MRRITGVLMLLAVLGLAAGCGKKGDDTSSSGGGGGGGGGSSGHSNIEGTYVIVGMEADGVDAGAFITKAPEDQRTIKITADKMIANKGGKEDPATYKVNNSKMPHEIDFVGNEGGKEEKMYGIYKVEGDKLIICMARSANDRPKEFKTTPEKPAEKKGGKKGDMSMEPKLMMMTLQKK